VVFGLGLLGLGLLGLGLLGLGLLGLGLLGLGLLGLGLLDLGLLGLGFLGLLGLFSAFLFSHADVEWEVVLAPAGGDGGGLYRRCEADAPAVWVAVDGRRSRCCIRRRGRRANDNGGATPGACTGHARPVPVRAHGLLL
jgi:hypothetical protein